MPKKPELSPEDQELRRAFGERVRDLRLSLKVTPAELAAVGGISMAHQYRIEAGERTAEILYLLRLLQRYGPEVNVLLGSTHPQQPATVHQSNVGNDVNQLAVVRGNVQIIGRRR